MEISLGRILHGKIDIALMQSCLEDSEVKPFVRDYGMLIVDECHHVSAVNFERILKYANARYVYGLTATSIRKDGHQPIIFMQCGLIRYSADAKVQMVSQTFTRLLVPRFTSYRELADEKSTYARMVQKMSEDENRNRLIIDDVCEALKEERCPIVLTSLTAHVETLASALIPHCKHVITLVGSESAKEKRLKMEYLQNIPSSEPLVIVATGKYVGEGFGFACLMERHRRAICRTAASGISGQERSPGLRLHRHSRTYVRCHVQAQTTWICLYRLSD